MLSNMCAELIDFLKKIISSQNFIKQHLQSPTDFIRQRKLPFSILIFFLINLIKGSYQDELDHFYKAIFSFDVAKRIVTKAALAKARLKLKYETFVDLNSHLIGYFYQNFRPQRMGLDPKPLKLRRIRVELDTGEAEILITSLLDTQIYPYEQFAEFYHLRWPVEEDYKTMKQWIEIENFSGKSVLSVYQDFHASVFLKNLTSALAYPTRSIIDTNTENCVYRYQKNFAQTLSKVKDVIPLLFIRSSEVLCKLISDIQDIIVKTIEPIRPGRKFPRNFNNRSGRFHYGYQPIR